MWSSYEKLTILQNIHYRAPPPFLLSALKSKIQHRANDKDAVEKIGSGKEVVANITLKTFENPGY